MDHRGPSSLRAASRTASRCRSTRSAAASTLRLADGQPGRQVLAEGLQQVAPVEPGGLRGQPGRAEQVLGDLAHRRRRRRPGAAQCRGDQPAGVKPGIAVPWLAHRSRSRRRAHSARLAGRVARHAAWAASGPDTPRSSIARLDLLAPGREHGEQVGRDADDLGDALLRCRPGDTEPLGELPAQHRVVEVGGGQRVPVHGPGVDRRPLAVRAAQQVRHHQVGVQLRVPGPRGAVLERGHDPPVGADPVGALPVALVPAQPVPGDRLQVGQRLTDRGLVAGADRGRDLRLAEAEQRR